MAEIKEEISLNCNVFKIVSKQCPITWTMEKPVLDNCHYHCPICGSLEKWNGPGNYQKMSQLQVDLFKNLVLALKFEASGGGGGGGGGGGDTSAIMDLEEGVQNFICSECMGKFATLESLQNEITLLEDKVEEILSQLRKTIRDRRGLISEPSLTVSNTEPASTTTDLPLMSDLGEEDEFEASTHRIMADADEEIDIKPVILEFQDEPKQLPDDDDFGHDDPLGGVDDMFQEHAPIKKPEEEGDCASANKSTRRCKIRATQVIADILRNNDDNEDEDNLNDEYSPSNESDTDSDDASELELKEHYKRPGIPPHPSTKGVQNEEDKQFCPEDMDTRLNKNRFSCRACHKTFSTNSDVVAHREKVHLPQLGHKCEKCGSGFNIASQFLNNMRIPCTNKLLQKRKIICPICQAGLSSKSSLRTHTREVHNDEKKIKCPHSSCTSRFSSEADGQLHFEICHPEDEPFSLKISCTVCSKKFCTAKEQLFHIQSIHTCIFCNKTFLNKAVRDKHKETHTGDHPYVCTKCGSTFSQRKVLKVHLKMTSCNPDKDEMDRIREKRWKYKRQLRIARKKDADL